MRVLLIEDEPTTAKAIELMLTTEGFNVYSTDLGEEGLDLGKLYDYDIILLDLNLPDMHGYDVLKKLRVAKVQTPVLILSGIAEMDSKVRSFGFGADDYVTKPYSLPELHARMNAVLRSATVYSPHQETPEFTKDHLKVNYLSHQVTVSGKGIELTSTEFNLLKELTTHAGEVMTHRALLHAVWGAEYGEEREYVRVFVNRLRQKLGDDPASPRFIKTEPGVGYLFLKGP